jgi:hypothetical protein
MNNTNFIKSALFTGLFAFFIPIFAQAQSEPSITEMAKQFETLQKMMMEGMQKGGYYNEDSSFVFKIDTSFFGNPNSLFKGNEEEMAQMQHFFGGFMDIIQDLGGNMPLGDAPEGSEYLDDKGGEDELLPEERLRLKEEGKESNDDNKMTTEPKPKKRKTVKI